MSLCGGSPARIPDLVLCHYKDNCIFFFSFYIYLSLCVLSFFLLSLSIFYLFFVYLSLCLALFYLSVSLLLSLPILLSMPSSLYLSHSLFSIYIISFVSLNLCYIIFRLLPLSLSLVPPWPGYTHGAGGCVILSMDDMTSPLDQSMFGSYGHVMGGVGWEW